MIRAAKTNAAISNDRFVVIAVVVVGFSRKKRSGGPSAAESAYERFPGLLTPAERSFFGVLEQAISAECRIFAKVRLADLVQPAATSSRSEWQRAFNRISGKHVDFVLCHAETLVVLGALELDDQSHERVARRDRDAFVDDALLRAGIPVVRFGAKHSYSPASVREASREMIANDVWESNRS